MNLTNYLDVALLQEHMERNNVKMQTHPVWPELVVYNYTAQCQWDQAWDDVTRKTRGLIVNRATGEILARPFEKFFNYGEPNAPLPDDKQPVRMQQKMDGSLGILYKKPDGKHGIATRGSFSSEQAIHASEVLRSRYPDFEPYEDFTYLFEIIYPKNRIVVNYEDMDDLVLIDVLYNETGVSYFSQAIDLDLWTGPFTLTRSWPSFSDALNTIEEAKEAGGEPSNEEGFVFLFKRDNVRLKFKFEEYKRLHRVMTGLTSRHLWEYLRDGDLDAITSLQNTVPDEFYEWVRTTTNDLHREFARTYNAVVREFQTIIERMGEKPADGSQDREHRKVFASIVKDSEFKGMLFGLYADQDISPMIWKRIKPPAEKALFERGEDVA